MAEKTHANPDPFISDATQGSSFALRPFVIGGLICIGFGILDSSCFGIAGANKWYGWSVWLTFAVFVVQTFVLSKYVGTQLTKSRSLVPAWIFFYLWSLVFINLILCMVLFTSDWSRGMQLSLCFAFFAAQIGLVLVWGVLGTFDWQKRIPLSVVGLIFAAHPLWLFGSPRAGRDWQRMLWYYIAGVFITCIILRLRRFRMTALTFGEVSQSDNEYRNQFSILQLLTWTSVVAVCFGVGRFIPWQLLWYQFRNEDFQFAVACGMLMTVITVATCWAGLGSSMPTQDSGKVWRALKPFARIPLLLILLGLCALGFSVSEVFITGSSAWSSSFVGGWNLKLQNSDHQKIIFGIWLAWAMLNGLFLFSMLQLFAVGGCRLARKPKHTDEGSK